MSSAFHQGLMPRLSARPGNQNKFCTHPIFNTYNSPLIVWKESYHLRRNFDLYAHYSFELKQLCSLLEEGQKIALFWREIAIGEREEEPWEPTNRRQLALEHLTAYFESHCYYAVKTIYSNYSQDSWEHYWSIARTFLYDRQKLLRVLEKYNSCRGSLENFVQNIIVKNIKAEASVQRFSPWRLLCKKSQVELKEALFSAGYGKIDVECCLLARKCFKQVYMMTKVKNPSRDVGTKWPVPDATDFQEAARSYNAEKKLPNCGQEVATSADVQEKDIEEWMNICINALQNYPNLMSVEIANEALQQEEINQGISTGSRSKFAPLINEKFYQEVLSLKPEQHRLCLLIYGAQCKQKQLEKLLGITQGSISRRANTIRKRFLQVLGEIYQENQWIDENYVLEWLKKSYRSPETSDLIDQALLVSVHNLESQNREILNLYYGQKLQLSEIASQWGMEIDIIETRLKLSIHLLQQNLLNTWQEWIKECVDKWLNKQYSLLFDKACRVLNLAWDCEVQQEMVEAIVQQTLKIIHKS